MLQVMTQGSSKRVSIINGIMDALSAQGLAYMPKPIVDMDIVIDDRADIENLQGDLHMIRSDMWNVLERILNEQKAKKSGEFATQIQLPF